MIYVNARLNWSPVAATAVVAVAAAAAFVDIISVMMRTLDAER
jgi:hypothetical protein